MPITVSKNGKPFVAGGTTSGGIRVVEDDIARLQRSEVLVGIPQAAASRKSGPLNNAELLYILTNGSALRNLPASPWLEPAIEESKKLWLPHMEAAATAILAKDPGKAQRELKLAGTIAANAAKRYPVDRGASVWPPLKPATIARKGSSVRNIDTGALRRAFVSLVREKP